MGTQGAVFGRHDQLLPEAVSDRGPVQAAGRKGARPAEVVLTPTAVFRASSQAPGASRGPAPRRKRPGRARALRRGAVFDAACRYHFASCRRLLLERRRAALPEIE